MKKWENKKSFELQKWGFVEERKGEFRYSKSKNFEFDLPTVTHCFHVEIVSLFQESEITLVRNDDRTDSIRLVSQQQTGIIVSRKCVYDREHDPDIIGCWTVRIC